MLGLLVQLNIMDGGSSGCMSQEPAIMHQAVMAAA